MRRECKITTRSLVQVTCMWNCGSNKTTTKKRELAHLDEKVEYV